MRLNYFRVTLAILFLCFVSLTTSCTLSGLKKYTNDFETETDEGAVERLRDWQIDLPKDTKVVHRSFSSFSGWDGYFWTAYYIFQVSEDYLFNSEILSSDREVFETEWSNLYDASSDWSEQVNNWPDFEKEMQCLITIRFKKVITKTDDSSSELEDDNSYYHKNVDKDENYGRLEGVGTYRYVGKGYSILQKNQHGLNYVYSFLLIDSSEIKYTKLY